mmetsp:Transcript_10462/g.16366  ORF Transcript_10462/g.16366 Transcript_10462/m.16366 type:complete len:351 (-) Transcript_10462:84-1136(-)
MMVPLDLNTPNPRTIAQVDTFTLVNFPCTYKPAPCTEVLPEDEAACQAGKEIWSQLGCAESGGFYDNFIAPRICNEVNYPNGNDKGYIHYAFEPGEGDGSVVHDKVGGCNCDFEKQKNSANFTGAYTGVPDYYIKDGMSTFYIRVVIGGRTTSARDDASCQCTGDDPRTDLSEACMCSLGKRKVPFVYNNGMIPYLTALISMTGGGLLYTSSFIKYDFEKNDIGCVGCTIDNCWGVPNANLDGWRQQDRWMDHKEKLMCAIPLKPDTLNSDGQTYCRYPQSVKEIEACTLKVYIAWVGTDGNNRPAQSSNEMFSRFTQMGVANYALNLYQGVSNLATDVERRVVGIDEAE